MASHAPLGREDSSPADLQRPLGVLRLCPHASSASLARQISFLISLIRLFAPERPRAARERQDRGRGSVGQTFPDDQQATWKLLQQATKNVMACGALIEPVPGGFDFYYNCGFQGQESLQWRLIGTTGINSNGAFVLAPALGSSVLGSAYTLTATVEDANNQPLANVKVIFQATSDPTPARPCRRRAPVNRSEGRHREPAAGAAADHFPGKRTTRSRGPSRGVTEIVEIPNRGHALTIDSGWRRWRTKRSPSSSASRREAQGCGLGPARAERDGMPPCRTCPTRQAVDGSSLDVAWNLSWARAAKITAACDRR